VTPLIRRNEHRVDISLYDLMNDPECKQDVSEEFPEVYKKLLNKLIQHYKDETTEENLNKTSKDIS